MKIDKINTEIIEFVIEHPNLSSSEIHQQMNLGVGLITVKRRLSKCVKQGFLKTVGVGRATKYFIHPNYKLLYPVNLDEYFKKEIYEREILSGFNFSLITEIFPKVDLFTPAEREKLFSLQQKYKQNISQVSKTVYNQELERLGIDLSWKSSQIEGNTYSLLETEQLLKYHFEAKGKKKEEAQMLLNHKVALDFIIENRDYFKGVSVAKIEEIHNLLVNDMGIEKNIRKRLVGITGTNYQPLDNEFQIKEALSDMCNLVNNKKDIFEKTLLLLILISYIQPFADGNKRTARLISNAILLNHNYCPLSFRTVDSMDYKKAMLLFYEQNNIQAFKTIFVNQYEFAVKTYFL